MSFDWYHRYPREFLQAVAKMPLEDRGAYATIIDLIFLYDSPLEDDDAVIAGHLHCHILKWRPIRERLIASGHLIAVDGSLDVPAIIQEVVWRRSRHNQLRAVGQRGGISSAARRKSNGLGQAHASSRVEESRGEENSYQGSSYLGADWDDEI